MGAAAAPREAPYSALFLARDYEFSATRISLSDSKTLIIARKKNGALKKDPLLAPEGLGAVLPLFRGRLKRAYFNNLTRWPTSSNASLVILPVTPRWAV